MPWPQGGTKSSSDTQSDSAFPGIRVFAAANSSFLVDVALGDMICDGLLMILKGFCFNLNDKKDNSCVCVIESQRGLG